jgi:flagellar biosynthesis protein FliP
LSGEKNIIKFLQIFGINPNIKHWKKDRKKQAENTIIAQTPNINTKKRLKKFLDAYFKKNDKKVSIDIDEIPTHMTPEKFYALCRGFHIENKQYYVVIDHDLKYIYKEKN